MATNPYRRQRAYRRNDEEVDEILLEAAIEQGMDVDTSYIAKENVTLQERRRALDRLTELLELELEEDQASVQRRRHYINAMPANRRRVYR